MTMQKIISTPTIIGTIMTHAGMSSLSPDCGATTAMPTKVTCDKHVDLKTELSAIRHTVASLFEATSSNSPTTLNTERIVKLKFVGFPYSRDTWVRYHNTICKITN